MDELINSERERCVGIVEEYWPRCHGNEEAIIVRIMRQMRLGYFPLRANAQFVATIDTPQAQPRNVDDERFRCLSCVLMHAHEGTTRLQAMLRETANRIARG